MLLLTLQFIVQIVEGLMGKAPELPKHGISRLPIREAETAKAHRG